MIVTLIGYRGCGKSSVGPLLAQHLGCACVDSDDAIATAAEKSIARIFSEDGESAFRDLETRVLADLLQQPAGVIAAGGGAILAQRNREAMKSAGPVVWLQASVETLAARIAGDDRSVVTRPSLTGQSIVEEVAQVLEQRRGLYADAATLTIDAETETPQQVADRIYAEINDDLVGDRS